MATTAAKLRDQEGALAWRRDIGTLVFTNGVFDLLHPGHVEYLEAARALGDALVVAVNTDRSARALAKGPGRPIAGEQARARVIAGLAAVDCVVLFDEPTPQALIAALTPDILVKGGDYAYAAMVGAEQVEAAGGRVVLVPFIPGYSSTALVEHCRAAT
jgi:D-beta-D-heptose 7-phosphate kinase/D-beta-D-heptose 1-phosphate adenosyltransferase